MSLILEALKKSERQRRLGEMPNLGTPMLASRRRRSLLPWLAGAIVVALAVGAWLRFAPPAETTTPARADAAPGTPAATPAQAPARTMPASPAPTAPAPVAAAPAKPAASDARRNLRLPAADDRPGSVAELPVSSLVAGPRKPPAATPAAPAPTAPAARPVAPKTAATTPVAKPAATAAATDALAARAKPARPAPRKPAVPALPSIWEMPYAVRKDLPALALTMHVYSSVPAERFVVVEGERHVEGDDLGDGVTLREIRSDGIVLDFKGKRFVYPRDGR